MLRAIPKRWYNWDFTVIDGPHEVADIDMSAWREKGQLTVEGGTYEMYREGLMSGAFILESGGEVVARAEKLSALRRTFRIEHAGKEYSLLAKSALRRQLFLIDNYEEVGSISPEGILTRRATVDLPEHLPLAVRVFIFWLGMLLWKREAES